MNIADLDQGTNCQRAGNRSRARLTCVPGQRDVFFLHLADKRTFHEKRSDPVPGRGRPPLIGLWTSRLDSCPKTVVRLRGAGSALCAAGEGPCGSRPAPSCSSVFTPAATTWRIQREEENKRGNGAREAGFKPPLTTDKQQRPDEPGQSWQRAGTRRRSLARAASDTTGRVQRAPAR